MKTLRRRRKENKTDYLKRIKLLRGGPKRIVFRKTDKYILSQLIQSKEAKDSVEKAASSKELLKHGWPENLKGSLKSLPASYFTGFLLGKKISSTKFEKTILDTGMIRKVPKSRFFAFLKGLKDSGIEIKCDEKHFPSIDRIKGKHLKEDFSGMFEKIK